LEFLPYPQVIPHFCNSGGCGPRRGLTPASPCPWIAHPVSGLIPATNVSSRPGPLQTGLPARVAPSWLAFAAAPRLCPPLNLVPWPMTAHGVAAEMNSPDHSTKGTPSPGAALSKEPAHLQASTACGCGGSGSLSSPFRGAFHLSLTVLVHYRWPVGVSPWRVVPPASHRISRVPWYSGIAPTEPVAVAYRALTVCGAASQRLRLTQLVDFYSATTRLAPAVVRCDPTTPPTPQLPAAPPVWAAPVSLATTPGISC
jgi:hypothetical protein